MIIATVVEGPTDYVLLEAVVRRLIPGDHRFRPLQPEVPPARTGAGWKGVRRWCRETWEVKGSSLELLLSSAAGERVDLLIIHVDCDVAGEQDLQEGVSDPVAAPNPLCPPISRTAGFLREVLARWLRVELAAFPQVVLALPAQDTESWTFAALFPGDELCVREDYECTQAGPQQNRHPGFRLTLPAYGKHLQRKPEGLKKSKRKYQELAPQVAAAWPTVCGICAQAQRLTDDVAASLNAASVQTDVAEDTGAYAVRPS